MYEQVRLQQKQFGILYEGKPRHLPAEEKSFYVKAFREEVSEYEEAESLEDEYDAILDLLVFSLGALLRQGFRKEGLTEVVKANLQKELGPNLGKRGDFKIDLRKPEGWTPPNLKKYL